MESRRILPLLGRILVSAIFISSGFNKFANWESTAGFMTSAGLPLVGILLPAAALVELVAGVMLLIGWNAKLAAGALFLFLVPTTAIFHDFWTFSGMERQMQMINFMKNLAIMGGLMEFAAFGAGAISFDERGRTRATTARVMSPA